MRGKNMREYKGKKFFYDRSEMIRDENIFWEEKYIEKKVFMINKKYKKYLIEKKLEELEDKIKLLKYKIENNLGDRELMINEFFFWLKEYENIKKRYDK
jgi:hypothetical protein